MKRATCVPAILVLSASVLPAAELSVIPRPARLSVTEGRFALRPSTRIIAANPDSMKVALLLEGYLAPSTGWSLSVSTGDARDNAIWIDAADRSPAVGQLGREGYVLSVTPTQVRISSSSASGAFWAVQTLRQLLPDGIFSRTPVEKGTWAVPCVSVSDSPRFEWRGLMLDVSRHFLNVDTIKRCLDLMALHKLNVLHWHLVDDHGWRIEIKRYPRLTTIGAFRKQPPIGRHGGFYTQEEIRGIVRYAADRHITIVPEIEMPGHSRAATASYPHLACRNEGGEVGRFHGYPCPAKSFPKVPGSNVLCAGKETTFEFLENVLTEVFDLFPGAFVHVGGDEVGKGYWKKCPDCQRRMKELGIKGLGRLQSYFMKRMERFINASGRRMIGWDEILEGGLAPNATVMSWRGERGGIAAARMGHDVVMTPQKPLYFDHGQTDAPGQPKHWPGRETLEEVYRYDPVPRALDAAQATHILGCQGNVWGAFVHSDEVLDCQTWPRGCALAETAWCAQDSKDLDAFLNRLAVHKRRLDELNVSYWEEPEVVETLAWSPQDTPAEYTARTWPLDAEIQPGRMYRVTFRWRKGRHGLDVRNVALEAGALSLADAHEGFTGSRDRRNVWGFSIPGTAPRTGWRLAAEIRGSAGTQSTGVISVALGKASWRRPRVVPALSTTTPVTHDRDERIYDWMTRHAKILERHRTVRPDVICIGDSITHYWSGEPASRLARGRSAWDVLFEGLEASNMGFGGDRTENVLWRLRNGELHHISPRVAMILIGTDNLAVDNTAREIYWGVQAIVDEIHERSPSTRILLVGLLPRKEVFACTPERVNNLLATLNDRPYVRFYNVNYQLLDSNGLLRKDLYRDGVHLNSKGYEAIAEVLKPVVDELMR